MSYVCLLFGLLPRLNLIVVKIKKIKKSAVVHTHI